MKEMISLRADAVALLAAPKFIGSLRCHYPVPQFRQFSSSGAAAILTHSDSLNVATISYRRIAYRRSH